MVAEKKKTHTSGWHPKIPEFIIIFPIRLAIWGYIYIYIYTIFRYTHTELHCPILDTIRSSWIDIHLPQKSATFAAHKLDGLGKKMPGLAAARARE